MKRPDARKLQIAIGVGVMVVTGFYVQGWYGQRTRARARLDAAWDAWASCAYGPKLKEHETPKGRVRAVLLGSGRERLGKCPWAELGAAAYGAHDDRSAPFRAFILKDSANPAERTDDVWAEVLWAKASIAQLTLEPSKTDLYPPKVAELFDWSRVPQVVRSAPFDTRHVGGTHVLVSDAQGFVCDFFGGTPGPSCFSIPVEGARVMTSLTPVDRTTVDVTPMARTFADTPKGGGLEVIDARTRQALGTAGPALALRAAGTTGLDAVIEEPKPTNGRFTRTARLDRTRAGKTTSYKLPPLGGVPVFVGTWLVYGSPKKLALSHAVKGVAQPLTADGPAGDAVPVGDVGPLDPMYPCTTGTFAGVSFPSGVSPVTRATVALSNGTRWKTFAVDRFPTKGGASCDGDVYRLGWLGRASGDGFDAGEVACTFDGCRVRTRKSIDLGDTPRFALLGSRWVVVFEQDKAVKIRTGTWDELDSKAGDRAVLDFTVKDAPPSSVPTVFAEAGKVYALWTGPDAKDKGKMFGLSVDANGNIAPVVWPAMK